MYLLISSIAKSYNFPKLSEAWVIFQGSKPDREETSHDKTMSKNRTISTSTFHAKVESQYKKNYIVTSLTKSSRLIMNNNYFSPVIVKYEEKSLVIVNIACQSLNLSLYQGFTVSTATKACVQSFSQKGACPAVLWMPIFGRNTRKIDFISYNFMGKQAFWKASFQSLAKSLHVWLTKSLFENTKS